MQPEERAEFLAEACGTDSSLREEIESLLSAYAVPMGFRAVAIPEAATSESEAQPLESIGPYKLIRKIGEGGMGQVWLAEQLEPIRRQVALKLIRSGIFDDALLGAFRPNASRWRSWIIPPSRRFSTPAPHPGPAVLRHGVCRRRAHHSYCDRKESTIQARLELFIKVCEGVQHAHQKAMIHRDLKPANILVVEVDGKPSPRLIDFGLAKAVASCPTEAKTAFTGVWGIAGTPGYISPEQATGATSTPAPMSTRSALCSTRSLPGRFPSRQKTGASNRSMKCCASCASRTLRAPAPASPRTGNSRSRLLPARHRAQATQEFAAWRSRLDRHESAGERSYPPLRNRARACRRVGRSSQPRAGASRGRPASHTARENMYAATGGLSPSPPCLWFCSRRLRWFRPSNSAASPASATVPTVLPIS